MQPRVKMTSVAWAAAAAIALPVAGQDILDPTSIPKYVQPLVIPPAMPPVERIGNVDYYEIAVRQFKQQVLPPGFPETTVWSYVSAADASTTFYPAFTIEARWKRPVRVKWINGLVDDTGRYLPHLLPVDQTLHWANPPGGQTGRDKRGFDPEPYTGPVPIVTHVHGARVGPESDGYPEAWYLPDAIDIPAGYARVGTHFGQFDPSNPDPGSAVFQYPNDQDAATLWFHDHALGITRLNVYAGPAGFYLLRGGPRDLPSHFLPGPAPMVGDAPGTRYYEIPLGIQDRSFGTDGSLFYPDNRAFFEGLEPSQLQIPFIPGAACGGMSDVSPIWNPEFFGNAIVVNGQTWPELEVEPRRYRLRLLNGCNSRFLILKLVSDPEARPGMPALNFWQIGGDGGFLPEPVELDQLLMSPAERADVIVDFTGLPVGTELYMINEGPDDPFRGGTPGVEFDWADPATTGQVMKFVITPLVSRDTSRAPDELRLPRVKRLREEVRTRQVSLNEEESQTVRVREAGGSITLACARGEPFAPIAATLGLVDGEKGIPLKWDDVPTETPSVGDTEIWEIHNFTEDAHPIHLHLVHFEVLDRRPLDEHGGAYPPEPWETGLKDTVIAYPEEITRIKAHFDIAGLYVWHCHILEHEDNEMMRPYQVLPRRRPMELAGSGGLSAFLGFMHAFEQGAPDADVDGDGAVTAVDLARFIDAYHASADGG